MEDKREEETQQQHDTTTPRHRHNTTHNTTQHKKQHNTTQRHRTKHQEQSTKRQTPSTNHQAPNAKRQTPSQAPRKQERTQDIYVSSVVPSPVVRCSFGIFATDVPLRLCYRRCRMYVCCCCCCCCRRRRRRCCCCFCDVLRVSTSTINHWRICVAATNLCRCSCRTVCLDADRGAALPPSGAPGVFGCTSVRLFSAFCFPPCFSASGEAHPRISL